MDKNYANEIVMFLGVAIAIGGLFPDYSNNSALVVSVTLAAVCFSFFDLINFYNKWYRMQKIVLFLGIFSIIVVPYLSFITTFLDKQNNFLTLLGLAIVMFLMGLKQKKQEEEDVEKLSKGIAKLEGIINEQNKIITEQNGLIKILTSNISGDNLQINGEIKSNDGSKQQG